MAQQVQSLGTALYRAGRCAGRFVCHLCHVAAHSRPDGVLLVNLGSPASPRPADVRRYLKEFLSDPRVLDMPTPLRWLLLRAVILPFRPRRSARQYASIWTP